MVRIVAEPNQLHAEVHYLVLHDVHSYLLFFSVPTCRSDSNKSPWRLPTSGLVSLTPALGPLTHVVLARDVPQDGVTLGDLVLPIHKVGQLEGNRDIVYLGLASSTLLEQRLARQ